MWELDPAAGHANRIVPAKFRQAAVVQCNSSRIAVMNIQKKLSYTTVMQRVAHRCTPSLPTPSIRHRLRAPRSTHLTTTDAAGSSTRQSDGSNNASSAAGLAVGVVGLALAGAYASPSEALAWGGNRSAATAASSSSSSTAVERMIAPPAASTTVTSPVNQHPDDSMGLIVIVCIGFWMLSATISAAIGKIFKLKGGNANYRYKPATWTSAGILDDIMRLPLAVEFEPVSPGVRSTGPVASGSGEALLVPWDGPSGSYLPASMVKVLRPGFREAGLVTGREASHLKPEISIVTRLVEDGDSGSGSSGSSSGGLGSSNGNGNGNGTGNGNGRGNGRGKKPQTEA